MSNSQNDGGQSEARFTPEKLVLGPFLDIWAAADIRLEDGKWRENVPEPRIMGGASALLSEEDRARYGRLWAAAPDMYEALIRAEESLKLVRSIISEGSAEGFNPLVGDWAGRLYASQADTHKAVAKARLALSKAGGPHHEG